ncbi:MAG: hypothetical protein MUC92_10795, partial [Fimbriimonadaceae bacterium]|nr:hypothetical protein [Fimbriimonadaceae bacterium]
MELPVQDGWGALKKSKDQAMRKLTILAGLTLLGAGLSTSAVAQPGWLTLCLDPANTAPYSDPYGTIGPEPTPLMDATVGLFGTVTYGGSAGPCYAPARSLDAAGRLAFGIGAVGSVQSNFDDGLALTTGWPIDAAGDFTFARFTLNSETPAGSVLFGDGGLRSWFVGASRRYAEIGWGNADLDVTLNLRLIGDAARLQWRVRNVATQANSVGMLFGCYPGMRSQVPDTGGSGNFFIANSDLGTTLGPPPFVNRFPERYAGWTVLPNGKPVRTERLWFLNDQDFPSNVKFMFGQTNAYGMRVDNIPPAETPDATATDFFIIGNHGFPGPGILNNNNMRLSVFGDPTGTQRQADLILTSVSFIQRFPGRTLAPGESRNIVHYIRSAQSVANYADPYTVVLDAPRLLSADNFQAGHQPSPATVRVWIDNQFATIDKEVALQNIRASIILPNGVSLAAGEQQTKFIPRIAPNELEFVDWQIVTNNTTYGDVPIQVVISPTPGPSKTIQTTIRLANLPTYNFTAGANLSSFPYRFGDASLDSILGLQAGRDYVAYTYDGDLRGYTPTQSVQRGIGYWIVPTSNLGQRALNGALPPDDAATGGLLVSLKQGWNLIGNPFNYPVKLDELIGVAEDSPSDALSWKELVEG